MFLGYNTNGFAHHRLTDAVAILAEIGYRSVALTLEREQLDPPTRIGVPGAVRLLKPIFDPSGLRVTIETGSRFILDPRRKHQPTLLSADPADRARRIEFLAAAIDIASEMGADSVALWSGTADDHAAVETLWHRLEESLAEVLRHAEARSIRLSVEPEPAMFVDTMRRFEALQARLEHPLLGLTLDVGHVHCLGDGDLADHARRWRDKLWNVHIEDMRRGLHEHLPFGEGEMGFAEVLAALRTADFRGPVHVELSRHSHDAVATATRAFAFLKPFVQ